MEIPAKYNPSQTEDKWYAYWLENKFFHSEPNDKEPYTIVIPPPNVTGVLHMGHMMNNTLQDVLIRRARMLGKNACWVPGTDHASISTETKVIGKLAAEGIKKTDLTREQFLEHAWEWTRKHGGLILQQLRKLGASCDWDRTAFTMDEERSRSVEKVFVDLYNKGLIYRGLRMVNWDPCNRTAISDDEVVYEQEKSKLYYLKYYVVGDPEKRYAVVATTRPETIMGDTAMCINPKDPKNEWLKGKKVIVPLVGREIPVIEDRYVDMEFGTGCLKVTPAHDKNDYMLGKKHNLDTIDIFNEDGTLSEAAGMYVGMDRFDVRKQISKDLEAAGLMEKIEDYVNNVGLSERTKVPIEPRLSMQWFVSMKHFADISLQPVMDDIIKFVPAKYKNTYRIWLENIQDWCISRQLWWGHRIPAWYYTAQDGSTAIAVAEDENGALLKAREQSGDNSLQLSDLRRDEDALDTWFSSWLWPITLFGGINNPGNEEIKYYYPTATLVTGPDIIFFWVARMIMAGYEYIGDFPFKNVYFTGIVRDKLGRKMSKMLGNSPDPLDLIAKYGADAVRIGMLLCSSAGNDIFYDESQVEQGRNFCNKIWNAYRLTRGWEVDENAVQPAASKLATEWFENKLNKAVEAINDHFEKFRIADATMTVYKLFWDDYCAWYLEAVKPAFGEKIDAVTFNKTMSFFDSLLKLIHPFMPFITEELWQNMEERKPGETIMLQMMPQPAEYSEKVLGLFDSAAETVMNIRNIRQSRGISPKEPVELYVKFPFDSTMVPIIAKLANVGAVNVVKAFDADMQGMNFLVSTAEFFIPLKVNAEEEKGKILAEIERYTKFLAGVEKKLSNEKFVSNAPAAVVELEKKKQADATEKLKSLNEQLQRFK